jgi:hypothetical protein
MIRDRAATDFDIVFRGDGDFGMDRDVAIPPPVLGPCL